MGLTVAEKSGRCEANEKVLDSSRYRFSSLQNYNTATRFAGGQKLRGIQAADQWFVSLDKDDPRGKAVAAADGVRFIPEFA